MNAKIAYITFLGLSAVALPVGLGMFIYLLTGTSLGASAGRLPQERPVVGCSVSPTADSHASPDRCARPSSHGGPERTATPQPSSVRSSGATQAPSCSSSPESGERCVEDGGDD